ncbi:MAG: ABC transporter permease [Phycisphaerales bacterium]|nr:ABC transporter permease [Phycisphaerales bacterium]
MRHWLQLATRNWWAKPFRAAAVVLAVALGVATVVAVVSVYHSVEYAIGEQVLDNWVGRSHLNIQTPLGHWGNVEPRLADEVAKLPNVARVTTRYNTPMRVRIPAAIDSLPPNRYRVDWPMIEINAIGIEPTQEYFFREPRELLGRLLEPGDDRQVVVDRQLARDLGLKIGDTLAIEPFIGDAAQDFTIVGTYAAARVAMFQRPGVYLPIKTVNTLRQTSRAISVIDVIVHDESPEALEATADKLRDIIRSRHWNYEVTTATVKLNQLRLAQQITRLVLVLFSAIALLTSFFIIVTTMSMGMMERIRLLGTLRCLGVTRGQLAALVLGEIVPLGVVGVALGIPIGMGLTHLGVATIPYMGTVIQQVVFGAWGITVAIVGGLLTTLACAGVIVAQVISVSPLRATTPQAQAHRIGPVILAAVVAVALLTVNYLMQEYVEPLTWIKPGVALVGMGCLYGGYVLLAPLLVLLVGSAALHLAAPLAGINRKLLRDQLGRAAWRSSGVCWMLMVGLSLIVFFAIRGESIVHAWDFPSKMAGAFVWSQRPFSADLIKDVRKLPGVVAVTPINDLLCSVKSREQSILNMLKSKSAFVAGDPETFLAMAQLEFLQGDVDDAKAKLERGGYVLLPAEASHAFGFGLGDKVPVTIGSVTADLEVAGVVRSPAMDIAVAFFQADTYMMIASASAVLGTLDDLQKKFGVYDHTMYLLDLDPGKSDVPPFFESPDRPRVMDEELAAKMEAWKPRLPYEAIPMPKRFQPTARDELRRYRDALDMAWRDWEELAPAERWQIYREGLILGRVEQVIKRPDAMTGSVRRLKQQIDKDIRTTTLIISAIPLVSLIIASIGVANLMMVNVASRSRQIAVLRAVGATKSQIARLVLAEAMVLGVIGCTVGVLLGMHAAHADNTVVGRALGIAFPWTVPWPRVIIAVALTWIICVVSGIGPALRAARSNVIGALQSS